MVLSVHKINRSIRSFGHKTARGARHFGHKAEKDFNHAGRVLKREGPKIRRGLHDTLATVHQVAGVGSSLLGSIGQATGSKQVMAAGSALGGVQTGAKLGSQLSASGAYRKKNRKNTIEKVSKTAQRAGNNVQFA